MTAADVIAALDRVLAEEGQTVKLRRYTAPSGTPRPKTESEDLRARVIPDHDKVLVGNVQQSFEVAILSPTGLAALLPLKNGDKLMMGARERNVEGVKAYYVGDTVVRLELKMIG